MISDSDRASVVEEITAAVIKHLNENPPVPKKYIDTQAAGAWLGMSEMRVAAMRRTGDGPVYHRTGWRCVRYTYAALDRWMAKNKERRDPAKPRRPGDPPLPGRSS